MEKELPTPKCFDKPDQATERLTEMFVDIGQDTYNLDPLRVREAVTERTKAVIAVHFGGTTCDMEAIDQI